MKVCQISKKKKKKPSFLSLTQSSLMHVINSPSLLQILNTAPFVKAIVLQSSGAEAFCYGHNMQAVRRALIENNDRQYVAKQFREASKLAYYIATCETPVVTILNGSVFGSGAGVGCFADFVISNPGTKYATPEVSYGYMPDSGNVFLLKKIDQKFPGVGMFLGLTGAQIKGFDLVQCDVSTHIGMPGTASLIMEKFAGDYEKSQTRTKLHDAVMHAVENDKTVSSEPLSFGQDLPSIEKCFHNKKTVEEIVTELNALANSTPDGINVTAIEWAKRTLAAINRVSPLALKVTHRAIHRAITEDLSLHACHNMEFRAGQHLVNSEDFKVGVDALVSGEGMPENWPSGTIESIDNASIDPFFNEPLVCNLSVKLTPPCVSGELNFIHLPDATKQTLEDHGTCDLELPMEVFMEDQLLMRLDKRGAKN